MTIDWSPVFNALAEMAIVTLAVVVATLRPYVVEFLRTRAEAFMAERTQVEREILSEVAYQAVLTAERLGLTSPEKKLIATNYIQKELAERGITVSSVVITQALEGALSLAKDPFAK